MAYLRGYTLCLTALMLVVARAEAFDTPAEFSAFARAEQSAAARVLPSPVRFTEITRSQSDWREPTADADDLAMLDAARRADWVETGRLLKAGARANAGEGQVLPLAAAGGQTELVRQLLAAGARVDQRGEGGLTPLGAATLRGHLPVVRLLLKAGADPERSNANGNTPLLEAAALDRLELFEMLLAAGADPMRMNREGHHALSLAAASGSLLVMDYLLRHGTAPDTPDRKLQSPLYWAMHQQQDDAVAALLAAGAQYDNMTPTMRR